VIKPDFGRNGTKDCPRVDQGRRGILPTHATCEVSICSSRVARLIVDSPEGQTSYQIGSDHSTVKICA
jgi:hypothetical protein